MFGNPFHAPGAKPGAPFSATISGAILLMLVVLVASFAGMRPARAACLSADSAITQAEAKGWRLDPLTGEAARRAIALYEAIPPEGPSGASEAALVHQSDGGGLILVGAAGAYCASGRIGPANWPAALDLVLGARS